MFYTLTLSSAANGFVDLNNNRLNAGASNYVTMFTVTASSLPFVSIPNFVPRSRSAGQCSYRRDSRQWRRRSSWDAITISDGHRRPER